MPVERHELTSRVVPAMPLATPGSLQPPPPLPSGKAAAAAGVNPALERFRVQGNAIVAGGVGDLGFAGCRALLEHGLGGLCIWDISLAGQAGERVEVLRADFPAARIVALAVDIIDADAVDAAVEFAVAELGGPVSFLANFAGVVSAVPSLEVGVGEFRRVMDINATGAFIASRAVARRMVADGMTSGSIVLLGSISGHQVNYPQPQAAYNASKAAQLMIKSSLAAEFAVHGIRVNSVSPGYMNTILNESAGLDDHKKVWYDRCPMGRMGEPDELTGAIVLLASRAGSYITGADIVVDGGQTLLL